MIGRFLTPRARVYTPTRSGGRKVAALGLITAALFVASTAAAAPPPRGMFPQKLSVGDRKLLLNGAGLAEWGVFGVDLYWAALYLESRTSQVPQMLDPAKAKSIHLHFVRALTRKQMVEAYSTSIQVNTGKDIARYQAGLDQLVAALTAVAKSDRLVFSYVPEEGLSIELNGKSRGSVAGAEFSRMFFRLYVGPNPPTKPLRKALIGKHPKSPPVPPQKPLKPKSATKPKAEAAKEVEKAQPSTKSRPKTQTRSSSQPRSRPTDPK
ncbi:MAG: chalcone isomerase family protein [Planctomycetota bacterium]